MVGSLAASSPRELAHSIPTQWRSRGGSPGSGKDVRGVLVGLPACMHRREAQDQTANTITRARASASSSASARVVRSAAGGCAAQCVTLCNHHNGEAMPCGAMEATASADGAQDVAISAIACGALVGGTAIWRGVGEWGNCRGVEGAPSAAYPAMLWEATPPLCAASEEGAPHTARSATSDHRAPWPFSSHFCRAAAAAVSLGTGELSLRGEVPEWLHRIRSSSLSQASPRRRCRSGSTAGSERHLQQGYSTFRGRHRLPSPGSRGPDYPCALGECWPCTALQMHWFW